MRTTSRFTLTRRELVLLAGFFITLLFVAPTSFVSDATQYLADVHINSHHGPFYSIEKGLSSTRSYPDPRLTWTGEVPETEMLFYSAGGTVFERLYLLNGTLFIVTSKPESIPELKNITSSGADIGHSSEERAKRLPTDKDIRIVSPAEAQRIFNSHSVSRLAGTTFLVTDSRQFIAHYYHFVGNMLLELWRTYTALDPTVSPDGHTALPAPARLLFRNVANTEWRDNPKMDQWVMHGAFPSAGMGFADDWADRAAMAVPFVFDRIVISDRSARYVGDWGGNLWWASTPVSELHSGKDWWTPIRASLLTFSGLPAEWITGPLPSERADNSKLVITYVSRQASKRRKLRQEDHEGLVTELNALRDRYGYEVNIASMEKLSRAEQMRLAGRTTILMGVHGNGLTALLWMRPTARSTVIEFFFPEGFLDDYQYPSRALGIKHYGIWNDKTFSYPDGPRHAYNPEGFQGVSIPVNGATVAELAHKRLTLEE